MISSKPNRRVFLAYKRFATRKPGFSSNAVAELADPLGLAWDDRLAAAVDHARSAIAEWANDFNHFRPHSSLGYQTPTDYAGFIAATGSNAAQRESFAFPPVAITAPFGVSKTTEALTAAG